MVGDLSALEARLSALDGDAPAAPCDRIDLLNQLAWALRDCDLARAGALAHSGPYAQSPYLPGLAYSLRTQSYVCMRRAELFEPLGIAARVPSTLDILCGILSFWSRYDEALALLRHINELATAQDCKRTWKVQIISQRT